PCSGGATGPPARWHAPPRPRRAPTRAAGDRVAGRGPVAGPPRSAGALCAATLSWDLLMQIFRDLTRSDARHTTMVLTPCTTSFRAGAHVALSPGPSREAPMIPTTAATTIAATAAAPTSPVLSLAN